MLNVLRDSLKTTPLLKVILVLVGVGLVAYLGNYFFDSSSGAVGNWAARVNGEEISFVDFRQRARQVDDRYRQMLGDAYDQFRQPARINQEALEALIGEQLVLQDAARLGLRASENEIADLVITNPQLQDPVTGQFVGTTRYLELLGGETAAAEYEQRLRNGLVKQRWAGLMGQAVTIDENKLRRTFRERTEKTAINYVIVNQADQTVDPETDPAVLRQWYDEHTSDYRRAESRRIRYVVVDRDALRDQVAVTESQIEEFYQANQSKYEHPEQRRARHILFRIDATASDAEKAEARERADETLAKVQGGEDFAALASSISDDTFSAENGGDLGFFDRSAMVEAFSQAAFSTGVGEFAPLTESPFGFHVIQVTDQRPQGVTPLEDLRDDIRRDLEVEAAQQLVQDEAGRLRGEVGATAERFAEVAEREGLEVRSRLVVGNDPLRDIGASPEFAVTITQMDPGSLSGPLRVAAGMALVTVDEVLPASIAPFDDVSEQVRKDQQQDRARRAAQAAAEKALSDHASFGAAAIALGKEPRESGDLRPGQAIPGAGGPSAEAEEKLFGPEITTGTLGVIEVPTGALAYEVIRREHFDPVRFDNEKGELRTELLIGERARYGQSVLNQLRRTQDIEINPQVLGFE